MTRLVTPGLMFTAAPMAYLDPPGSTPNLEEGPKRNELYVVCKDGSIQSFYEPDRPIGWELIEEGHETYYRVTQMNHSRKRCAIWFHSRTDDPPAGRGFVGADAPQNAEVIEARDDGQEVTSRLDTIARNLNPELAACAAIVNDPEQTEALARFAEGRMSYAEMRARCG